MPIGAHSADHWHFCPAIAIAAAEFLAGPICLPLANLGALTYARWPPLVGPAFTTRGRSEDVILHGALYIIVLMRPIKVSHRKLNHYEALLYHVMASTTILAADSRSPATGATSPAERGRDIGDVGDRLPLDPRGPALYRGVEICRPERRKLALAGTRPTLTGSEGFTA